MQDSADNGAPRRTVIPDLKAKTSERATVDLEPIIEKASKMNVQINVKTIELLQNMGLSLIDIERLIELTSVYNYGSCIYRLERIKQGYITRNICGKPVDYYQILIP